MFFCWAAAPATTLRSWPTWLEARAAGKLMTSGNHLFPVSLSKLMSPLPAYPGSLIFAGGLNLLLAPHLHADTLRKLPEQALRLQTRHAGVAVDFLRLGERGVG